MNQLKKYLPKGAGSIFSFDVVGGEEAARKVIDSLEIFSNLANVADAKSLVVHPAIYNSWSIKSGGVSLRRYHSISNSFINRFRKMPMI